MYSLENSLNTTYSPTRAHDAIIGNMAASFLVIFSGFCNSSMKSRMIGVRFGNLFSDRLPYIFLMVVDGAVCTEEYGQEGHYDDAPVRHRHPFGGAWWLPRRICSIFFHIFCSLCHDYIDNVCHVLKRPK
jgi:hypothetical protein